MTLTVERISTFKSRIYSLKMMGAEKSLSILKRNILSEFLAADECNRSWIADNWFGRCANRSFDDVIAELS